MWDESLENTTTTTDIKNELNKPSQTEVHNKLQKLAEKWKYDFFSCREASVDNIQEVLDSNNTVVSIEYDDTQKMIARIFCVICSRPIRIGYLKHNTRNGETYNFSNTNYFHHLKTHSIVKHVAVSRSMKRLTASSVSECESSILIPKIDPNEEEDVM